MRITEVNIPKEEVGDGLEDITMKRLGDIVILAGKNGSGKTRVLNRIIKYFHEKPTIRRIKDIMGDLEYYRNEITRCTNRMKEIESNIERLHSYDNHAREIDENERLKNEIKETERKIENNNILLTWNFITTNEESEIYYSIPFVPKETELNSPNMYTKDSLHNNIKSLKKLGTHKSLREATLAQIQVIQDGWFNTTHPEVTTSDDDKRQAEEGYFKLRDVIKEFLGEELSRDKNGDATLFGLPIGDAKLSDGQKILLQLGVVIYSQRAELENLILVLDEPENHLHPSVIIEVIDTLRNTLKNGQIWMQLIPYHYYRILVHHIFGLLKMGLLVMPVKFRKRCLKVYLVMKKQF